MMKIEYSDPRSTIKIELKAMYGFLSTLKKYHNGIIEEADTIELHETLYCLTNVKAIYEYQNKTNKHEPVCLARTDLPAAERT